MACLNMLNNEQQQQQQSQQPHHSLYNTMSPRISFSSDFGDPQQQPIKLDSSYREAPVSSDFAFSVPSYSMISADEVFFKGKMLPLRENCGGRTTTTLKDELLVGDDDDEDVFSRFGKGGGSWKERLGIRRAAAACVVRKRSGGSFGSVDEICVKFRG